MLSIHFHPESDKKELIESAKEYQLLWNKHQKQVIETMEQITGLSFKTKAINAIVFNGVGFSYPLQLYFNHITEMKLCAVIHELCHRLTIENGIKVKVIIDNQIEESHKFINLILYDIWTEVTGKSNANNAVEIERKYGSAYERSWDYALSFQTKEKRQKQFKTLVQKYRKSM